MAWRVAKSLQVLLDEINDVAPDRSKASDGSIGDAAHQAEPSDHNPNGAGVVTARDFTHDPGHGADMGAISEYLRTHRHRDLKYLIFNRRIAGDWTGWRWQSYSGVNPHTKHLHVSVGRGPDGAGRPPYDDTTPWGVREEFGMPSAKEIADELAKNKKFLVAVGQAVWNADDLIAAVPPPHANSDYDTNKYWTAKYTLSDTVRKIRAVYAAVVGGAGGEPPTTGS